MSAIRIWSSLFGGDSSIDFDTPEPWTTLVHEHSFVPFPLQTAEHRHRDRRIYCEGCGEVRNIEATPALPERHPEP